MANNSAHEAIELVAPEADAPVISEALARRLSNLTSMATTMAGWISKGDDPQWCAKQIQDVCADIEAEIRQAQGK